MSDNSLLEALQAAGKLKSEPVQIPAGKGTLSVTVRELSTAELIDYQQATKIDATDGMAILLSKAVYNEQGDPALSLEQAKTLMAGSARVVTPLVRTAMRLSGLSTDSDEDSGEKKD